LEFAEEQFKERLFPAISDGLQDPMADEISAALMIVPRIDALKKIFWEILGFERRNDPLSLNLLAPRTELSLDSIQVFGQLAEFRVIIVRLRPEFRWLWMNIRPILDDVFSKLEESIVLITDIGERRWLLVARGTGAKLYSGIPLFKGERSEIEVLTEIAVAIGKRIYKSTIEVDQAVVQAFDDEHYIRILKQWQAHLRHLSRLSKEPEPSLLSIDQWWIHARKYSLLTPKQEKSLFTQLTSLWPKPRKIFPNTDLPEARHIAELCVLHNLRLVAWIAYKYAWKLSQSIDLIDLFQEGTLGLMIAVSRFEPKRKLKFSTFATYWIRQKVTRYIQDNFYLIRLPVHIHESLSRYRNLQEDLSKGETSLRILCRRHRISPDQLNLFENLPIKRVNFHTDSSTRRQKNNRYPIENIASSCDLSGRIDEIFQSECIKLGLRTLTDRQRAIIEMRFGLNGFQEMTLEEVGKSFGVTRERIRQIEVKALGKLSRKFKKAGLH